VSVSKSQVEAVRNALSSLDLGKAKAVANAVLAAKTPEEAKAAALNALSA
jgi:phosphotransferase system enzyme I (PtsI)